MSLKSVKDIEDPALAGPDGKTVYLFEGDKDGKPTCKDACAGLWPPVTASGMPTAGSGLDQSLLGTVKRADGSTQVTYAGHPLYYYSGDSSPGTALGQGMSAFHACPYALLLPVAENWSEVSRVDAPSAFATPSSVTGAAVCAWEWTVCNAAASTTATNTLCIRTS